MRELQVQARQLRLDVQRRRARRRALLLRLRGQALTLFQLLHHAQFHQVGVGRLLLARIQPVHADTAVRPLVPVALQPAAQPLLGLLAVQLVVHAARLARRALHAVPHGGPEHQLAPQFLGDLEPVGLALDDAVQCVLLEALHEAVDRLGNLFLQPDRQRRAVAAAARAALRQVHLLLVGRLHELVAEGHEQVLQAVGGRLEHRVLQQRRPRGVGHQVLRLHGAERGQRAEGVVHGGEERDEVAQADGEHLPERGVDGGPVGVDGADVGVGELDGGDGGEDARGEGEHGEQAVAAVQQQLVAPVVLRTLHLALTRRRAARAHQHLLHPLHLLHDGLRQLALARAALVQALHVGDDGDLQPAQQQRQHALLHQRHVHRVRALRQAAVRGAGQLRGEHAPHGETLAQQHAVLLRHHVDLRDDANLHRCDVAVLIAHDRARHGRRHARHVAHHQERGERVALEQDRAAGVLALRLLRGQQRLQLRQHLQQQPLEQLREGQRRHGLRGQRHAGDGGGEIERLHELAQLLDDLPAARARGDGGGDAVHEDLLGLGGGGGRGGGGE